MFDINNVHSYHNKHLLLKKSTLYREVYLVDDDTLHFVLL